MDKLTTEQGRDFVIKKSQELIAYLSGLIPESDEYNQTQVIINTLMFSYLVIFKECVVKEKQELYLEEFINKLRENMKIAREEIK